MLSFILLYPTSTGLHLVFGKLSDYKIHHGKTPKHFYLAENQTVLSCNHDIVQTRLFF
jgi:hypothetical protein